MFANHDRSGADSVGSGTLCDLSHIGDHAHPLALDFQKFVADAHFPCVGAKSALATEGMYFIIARDLRSGWDDLRIHQQIERFTKLARWRRGKFSSCVIIFETDPRLGEVGFEHALWDRLQSLSDKDRWLGFAPDPDVSVDPADPLFALNFAGEAFFAVGLHPGASRPARRFSRPAIVLNLHRQFRELRASGRYEKMRATILDRDEKMAGSINPMLARHGSISEARQYSGRAVADDWQCPFHRAEPDDLADAA